MSRPSSPPPVPSPALREATSALSLRSRTLRDNGPDLVLRGLSQLLRDGVLADIDIIIPKPQARIPSSSSATEQALVAGGAVEVERRFSLHRAVLAAASDYFRATFAEHPSNAGVATPTWRETGERELILHDIAAEPFAVVVQFVYTGEMTFESCEISKLNVVRDLVPVLEVADRLGIEGAKTVLVAHIATRLNFANSFVVLSLASRYSIQSLRNDAVRVLAENFHECSQQQEFLELQPEEMCSVVSHDGLASSEEELFVSFEKWFRVQPQSAGKVEHDDDTLDAPSNVQASKGFQYDLEFNRAIVRILEAIRFPLMSARFLSLNVKSSCLMQFEPLARRLTELLMEAFELHAFKDSPSQDSPRAAARRRKSTVVSERRSGGSGESDGEEVLDMLEFLRRVPPPDDPTRGSLLAASSGSRRTRNLPRRSSSIQS